MVVSIAIQIVAGRRRSLSLSLSRSTEEDVAPSPSAVGNELKSFEESRTGSRISPTLIAGRSAGRNIEYRLLMPETPALKKQSTASSRPSKAVGKRLCSVNLAQRLPVPANEKKKTSIHKPTAVQSVANCIDQLLLPTIFFSISMEPVLEMIFKKFIQGVQPATTTSLPRKLHSHHTTIHHTMKAIR